MSAKKLDELVRTMENHLECWKQLNHYFALARTKKFEPEDEAQFLEIKSVITQELEIILSAVETSNPSKDDILGLLTGAPSIRYMAEMQEASLKNMENQWHKIYIAWQSLLGQLKVQQRQTEKKSFWSSLFGK